MIELTWINNKEKLDDRIVYFPRGESCIKITKYDVNVVDELQSNHEEADTKVAYLLKHAVENINDENSVCVVRSCSGDIDIPLILLPIKWPETSKILIDNGREKHRKILNINDNDLSDIDRTALVGLHAFTGCDQNSSFLKKGKKTCWNTMKKDEKYLHVFTDLGKEDKVTEELYTTLEQFVCQLYGEKHTSNVNHARHKIFQRILKEKNQFVDLSLLPSCQSSLKLHDRSNYISRIWRKASHPIISIENSSCHGWNEDLTMKWVDDAHPRGIKLLLFNDENDDFVDNLTDDTDEILEKECDHEEEF